MQNSSFSGVSGLSYSGSRPPSNMIIICVVYGRFLQFAHSPSKLDKACCKKPLVADSSIHSSLSFIVLPFVACSYSAF